MEYASTAVGNAGLATGIIGTALGVLNGGAGLLGAHGLMDRGYMGREFDMNHYATKEDLHYVQEISRKDAEIALLKSEQNTEVKIADVYERLITKINANAKDQADWNASQSVANAHMSAAIAANRESISDLQRTCGQITKVVIPNYSICPGWGDVTVTPVAPATTPAATA